MSDEPAEVVAADQAEECYLRYCYHMLEICLSASLCERSKSVLP